LKFLPLFDFEEFGGTDFGNEFGGTDFRNEFWGADFGNEFRFRGTDLRDAYQQELLYILREF